MTCARTCVVLLAMLSLLQVQAFVGGDRDGHGCCGSCGYHYSNTCSKCIRVWEEPECDDSKQKPAGQAKCDEMKGPKRGMCPMARCMRPPAGCTYATRYHLTGKGARSTCCPRTCYFVSSADGQPCAASSGSVSHGPLSVCKATEFCCPDAKHCLTPTATSCAAGPTCAAGQVCCPLTKICVKPGAACTSPCADQKSYCCPDAKHCLTPTNPGHFCKANSECHGKQVCCPLTKLCVLVGAACTPPLPAFMQPKLGHGQACRTVLNGKVVLNKPCAAGLVCRSNQGMYNPSMQTSACASRNDRLPPMAPPHRGRVIGQ